MTKIETGVPAFPAYDFTEGGMTLRDYFAAKALNGLLAGQFRDTGILNLKELPEEAYSIADAMLAARGGDRD
ncbi:hypothetical protein HWX16_16345 [Ochrobactrum intermedium]|uniref:hypothetical protein n=1 Tax=Brucella intermedia TaxID=94625 RepID=UPI00159C800A|nr:hypothetical protein [Brucella intermedia]NVM41899.1 hypothetical protein [Brucella intermedia]